jgi:predicted transcriptional regulator
MDSLEQVKKLREEYERALDAADSRRVAYHEAVLDLYRTGTPLREIANELGLSHQRVHQIVSGEPPRRSKLPRAAGGIGAVLILAAATFGALRLAQAPPFVPHASVPSVLNMPESVAVRRVENAGLNARVVYRERNVTRALAHRVYAESGTPGARLAKGSTVTLYVAIQYHWATNSRAHSRSTLVAFRGFGGIRRPPGGAALRKKRLVVTGATVVGQASIWRAPDRVSPAHCQWLVIDGAVWGGSCLRNNTPRRGLPEVVPLVLPIRGRSLPLLWGVAGANVARLSIIFQDGTHTSLPHPDGVFLYPVPQLRWSKGHRPVLIVARDSHNRLVSKRPLYGRTAP